MKRNNIATAIALSMIFVCLIISNAASQEAGQKIWRLKHWTVHNLNQFEGAIEARFVDSVKAATGGRVIITPYWNASLTDRKEAFRALLNGVFETGTFSTPDAPGQFPVSDVSSLPFLFKSSEEALNAINRLYNKGLMPEYNQIKLCTSLMTDMQYMMLCKKEVQKLEDLKGMKIRVPPGIPNEIIRALGATPVGMRTSEMYMAASRGIVDGFITSPSRIAAYKLWEVAKVFLDVPVYVGCRFLAMNLDTWNSFPDDIKAILEKEFAKMGREWLEENTNNENKAKDGAREKGFKFITLSPSEIARWKQATKPVEAAFIKKLNDLGLQGQRVMDVAKATTTSK